MACQQDRRQALETLVTNDRLSMDARLDQLCTFTTIEHTIEDVLYVLQAVQVQVDHSTMVSTLRLLLDRADLADHSKALVLKRLVSVCADNQYQTVLVHPVMAAIMADHRLLRLCLLHNVSLPDAIISFLFDEDADALFEATLLAFARRALSPKFEKYAKRYLTSSDSVTAESVIALAEYCEDSVKVLLKVSDDDFSVSLLDLINRKSVHGNVEMMAVLLRSAWLLSVDDYERFYQSVSFEENENVRAVDGLCRLTLQCRFAGTETANVKLSAVACDYPFTTLQKCLKKHSFLVDCLMVLSNVNIDYNHTYTSNLHNELYTRCLIAALGHQFTVTTLDRFVSLSSISMAMSHTVVTVCKQLIKDGKPKHSIFMSLSRHSRSLPILAFLISQLDNCDNLLTIGKLLVEEPQARQSTLDTVAARLRDHEDRFMDPPTISQAIHLWSSLCRVGYVSPLAVYNEVVKRNQWHKRPISEALCDLIGCMSMLEGDDLEEQVRECLQEHVLCLFSMEHRVRQSNNLDCVFECLSRFITSKHSASVLDLIVGSVDAKTVVSCAIASSTINDSKVKVLQWITKHAIDNMSREQLLALRQRRSAVSLPHLPTGLFTSCLEHRAVPQLPLSVLELYPWFMRMEMVRVVAEFVDVEEGLGELGEGGDVVDCIAGGLLIAACKYKGVQVSEEMVHKISRGLTGMASNEFVAFILQCIIVGTDGSSTSATGTMASSMAAALYQNDSLGTLAWSYIHKGDSVNMIVDGSDYNDAILTILNHKQIESTEECKLLMKQVNQIAVREPLDSQGCLHHFAATKCKSLSLLAPPSLHSLPMARLVHHLATLSGCPSLASDQVELEAVEVCSRVKRLLPWADWLVYKRHHEECKEDLGEVGGSVERFGEESVFRQLVEAGLHGHADLTLAVLTGLDTIPVMDWTGLLHGQDAAWQFMLKHVYTSGARRRVNESILRGIHSRLKSGTDAETLCEVLKRGIPLPQEYAVEGPTKLATIIRYADNIGDSVLDTLIGLVEWDKEDSRLQCELLERCGRRPLKDSWFAMATVIYNAHKDGSIVDLVNSVDCTSHVRLLAHLLTTHQIALIINQQLANQLRTLQ